MYTRAIDPLPSMAPLLPSDHPREAYRLAISQVQLAAKIADAFRGILERLVREENEGLVSGPDAEVDSQVWTDMEARLQELLADPNMTSKSSQPRS